VTDYKAIGDRMRLLGRRYDLANTDAPFEYTRKVYGTATEHCSHCPLPPVERCTRTCSSAYEALEKQRAADGVKVTE
jgi:uncharacterized OB-fold protein